MKTIKAIVCSIVLMLVVILVMPSSKTINAASLKDSTIITYNQEISSNTAIITANLKQNTGICGMKLEISYDKDNLTLDDIEFGTALRSLNPIKTGDATTSDKIILNWESDFETIQNDTSTGILLVMKFTLKDGIADGTYKVGFKYDKSHDIVYLDTDKQIKYKSLISDAANIIIETKDITDIEIIEKDINDDDGRLATAALAGIIAGGVFVVGSVTFLIILLVKRRKKEDKNKNDDWGQI